MGREGGRPGRGRVGEGGGGPAASWGVACCICGASRFFLFRSAALGRRSAKGRPRSVRQLSLRPVARAPLSRAARSAPSVRWWRTARKVTAGSSGFGVATSSASTSRYRSMSVPSSRSRRSGSRISMASTSVAFGVSRSRSTRSSAVTREPSGAYERTLCGRGGAAPPSAGSTTAAAGLAFGFGLGLGPVSFGGASMGGSAAGGGASVPGRRSPAAGPPRGRSRGSSIFIEVISASPGTLGQVPISEVPITTASASPGAATDRVTAMPARPAAFIDAPAGPGRPHGRGERKASSARAAADAGAVGARGRSRAATAIDLAVGRAGALHAALAGGAAHVARALAPHVAVGRAAAVDMAVRSDVGRAALLHPYAGDATTRAASGVTAPGPGAGGGAVVPAGPRAVVVLLSTPQRAVGHGRVAAVLARRADRAVAHPVVGGIAAGILAIATPRRAGHGRDPGEDGEDRNARAVRQALGHPPSKYLGSGGIGIYRHGRPSNSRREGRPVMDGSMFWMSGK